MGLLVFGLILGVAGIIGIVMGRSRTARSEPSKHGLGLKLPFSAGGVVLVVLALLAIIGSTIRIVPPRSVGIEVTLGKVTNTWNSGPHIVKPWSSVKNFPSTIQTTRLQGNGGGGGDNDGPCVTVRLGNQTTACVNVTTQWQINTQDESGVEALYTAWRGFDHIEPNLVRPQLQHALLAPFETYDPLKVLQENANLVAPTKDLEKATRDELSRAVGSGITITQLTINLVTYDQTTQDKINGYAQAVADTRIAEQRKSTAEAQRQANDALASSASSKDPGVLTQNCLDLTERMVKEGKGLPAGWTCLGDAATPVVNVR